jgi:predicted phosphodiesterase
MSHLDEPLAVISDIHGNRWALEAVLEDITNRGIRQIVNLGDCLYGPLDPAGTAALLRGLNLPTVRGNEDRILVRPGKLDEESPSLKFTRRQLKPADLRWLAALPATLRLEKEIYLCHASPRSDNQYLLARVTHKGIVPRSRAELEVALRSAKCQLLLCGHDHVPHDVRLPEGMLIVGPGSVGLPAYRSSHPYPHAMENGAPHARYAIVWKQDDKWQVRQVFVRYSWENAARVALQNGRPDWSVWLSTGLASPQLKGRKNAAG